MRRLAVLISGRGSNLQALIDAIRDGRLEASLVLVISNRPEAGGLGRARDAGIETMCLDHRGWPTRDDYDRALADALQKRDVDLVCLAGFMRKVGRPLLDAFPNRILNVHPSLLPAFPGLDAQAQALAYGAKISGVTVHLVSEELDAGPIVLQRAVPVLEDDTPASLAARILVQEHLALPDAVAAVLNGGWAIDGRRFVVRSASGA